MAQHIVGHPPLSARIPVTAQVDLHMHTTASDGIWTPPELVETALEKGLRLIAVTDHNTVEHIRPVRAAAEEQDLIVLGGCEVSTNFRGKLFHLLCLGLDPDDPAWLRVQKRVERGRRRMYDEVIDFLAEKGYRINRAHLYIDPETDEPIYIKTPITTGLMNEGYIQAKEEVAAILERTGAHFASEYASIPMEELDSVLGDAYAVRVIAHPGRDERGVSHLLDTATLKALGDVTRIDGLEATHPYHRPEQVGEYERMAREFGMVISCGSDAHHLRRTLKPHPAAYCRDLLQRCGVELEVK